MQRRNTSSLFWFMKRMINMRKNYKAFGRGDLNFIPVDNPKVLAFTRKHDDETLLIQVEFDPKDISGLSVGLTAQVSLIGYSRRSVPSIPGILVMLSADSITDPAASPILSVRCKSRRMRFGGSRE